MGISTVASYTGAQVFEAVGLARGVVDEYFTGTAEPHRRRRASTCWPPRWPRATAWPTCDRPAERAHRELEVGGEYQWRREGEYHLFNPKTVFKLQHATRAKRYDIFKEYTAAVDDQSEQPGHPARPDARSGAGVACRPSRSTRSSRSSAIVKRFSTGAMSYGSISAEAHETLAIAMNRLGGRSNTGEGGEDPDRFTARRQRRPPAQRHQAGGLGPLRGHLASTSSTPTTSRSRSPRGPSPARAASSRVTRSTRGSPRPGTPHPGSG